MGRKKNPEIRLWNMKEMIEYAKEEYDFFKDNINKGWWPRGNAERAIRRYIEKYVFVKNNKDDMSNKDDMDNKDDTSNKNDTDNKDDTSNKDDTDNKNNKKNSSAREYKLHPELAKFIIKYIMMDYFCKDSPKLIKKHIAKLQQQEEERHKEKMSFIKKLSEREDEKLNQAIMKQLGEYHLAEYDDETFWEAPLPEGCTYDDETTFVSDGAYYYDFTPDLDDLNNRTHEYHIPMESSYSNEFADKVIDRMMIRAIFDYIFEFKEEEFRRDLEERSKMIDTMEPLQVHPGFTELTKKLENPLENYISLKEVQKK